ncbi:MAG TPA: type II toxin-antitoxin system PemK/MazF family toxin [Bryobacteraceae bacterium]|nr:type II toxin-antitoxin system PemK/MazF family toxin [Bryobacteraceae bacterium]
MKAAYVPDAGDLVFDPQAAREQAGRRPALVLSPRFYNVRTFQHATELAASSSQTAPD